MTFLVKTVRKKAVKNIEEEEMEEPVTTRMSNRSKKIKKLGEEYDTSDWKRIGGTRTSNTTTTKKQRQAEQAEKKNKGTDC